MATTHTSLTQPKARVRPAWLVILLCWLIVVFDGYDLIVYGTTLPSILAEPGRGLTVTTAGLIGSLAFLGMLVGALAAGRLADALGRRRTILWCTQCCWSWYKPKKRSQAGIWSGFSELYGPSALQAIRTRAVLEEGRRYNL